MSIESLICPQCGGALTQKSKFCPYCGCEIDLGNEKTYTYNYNYTDTNTADVIRAESEAEGNKEKWKFINRITTPRKWETKDTFLTVSAIFFMFFLMAILYFLINQDEMAEQRKISKGMVSLGYDSTYCDRNYKEVKTLIEAKGFKDIELIDLNDADGENKIEDCVSSISVGGDDNFNKDDYFSTDEKVIIIYH